MIQIADQPMSARMIGQDAGKLRGCCYAVLFVAGKGWVNKSLSQFEDLRHGQQVAIYWEDSHGDTYYVGKLVREDECPEA